MQKKAIFKTKGMQRDLAASAFTSEFAYENKNIRITATDDNTLLSIVNERGNSEIIFCKYNDGDIVKDTNLKIKGTPIGVASINEYIVLFTHDDISNDFIYYIKIDNDKFILQELYAGNLGFSKLNPIETLASYENDEVIKVYWVDGKNQPRVINIVAPEEVRNNWVNTSFDFIQELKLNEIINVTRTNTSGSFAAGVIQYAFSYYNKNAQETNIFYTTPINYISYDDRGGSPEDTVVNSFNISVNNVDKNFDYLRIYSIHRTSIDATPTVKLVADVKVPEPSEPSIRVSFLDTGNIGSIIDPVELLYKGGEYIIPKTLAQKDGTLFLGNIKVKSDNIDGLEELLESWRDSSNFLWSNRVISSGQELQGYYPYSNPLGQQDITGFKARETYRLGIQFQHISGKWIEPILFDDVLVNTNPKCQHSSNTVSYYTTQGSLKIPQNIKEWAASKNYIRVRPVVVFPSEGEREVIAQGVLCPTVFNARDRHSGTCFSQSSWFFRPNPSVFINRYYYENIDTTNDKYEDVNIPEYGAWPEFRHFKSLPSYFERNAEIQTSIKMISKDIYGNSIQSLKNLDAFYLDYAENGSITELLFKSSNVFADTYFIDQSVVTFHSPEIELEKVTNIDNCKIRIVGISEIDTNAGDISISLDSAPYSTDLLNIYTSAYKGCSYGNSYQKVNRSLLSGLFYYDKRTTTVEKYCAAMVYPWHTESTLHPYSTTSEYGKLKNKKLSNLKFSLCSKYITPIEVSGKTSLYDGDTSIVLKAPENIKTTQGNEVSLKYRGNVDDIITCSYEDLEFYVYDKDELNLLLYDEKTAVLNLSEGRPRARVEYTREDLEEGYNKIFNLPIGNGISENASSSQYYTKQPISIKYKSTPHAVVALNYTVNPDGKIIQNILPSPLNLTDLNFELPVYSYGNIQFDSIKSLDISNIEYTPSNASLWLAELYREVPNKFGGNEYSSNLWLPAGKPVRIVGATKNEQGKYTANTLSTVVYFTQGDTFFARFDSLKTYPYTLEDTNSIVEIGSFMVETRINLDARYDRNRGKKSNLVMTPTNFNLFNEVYNQKDTFFNYRIKDEKYGDTTNFPNLITYTKTKTAGELVDTWTNITLASTLDLDGDKGEVTALRRLNNNIIAFQDTGISQILYNENVQIASTEGVPIEIANSGKVTGKRYISDKIGCTNKWSICETPSGLYFIDDITKGIYLFNGQLNNISDRLGFNSWINKHSNLSVWNPEEFSNFITYYDKVNGDVLFVNKDECLAFSEALGQFTSFYSYEGMSFFTSLKGKGVSFKDNNDGNFTAWLHNEGDYNMYYGSYKPFYTTVIANPNPTTDKVFNNLEFRADSWQWNEETNKWDLLNETFDTLTTWNEYQEGTLALDNKMYRPSSLKRKFRIWRANIPRDKSNGRDRMRNPWLYIKLSKETENTNKTILHDMVVSYFE